MHVLYCPLASHGFVFPLLGLAHEMAERGHSAAFATDASFAPIVAREGFERVPRSATLDGPSFRVSRWSEAPAVAEQVAHVLHAVGRSRPDLLVGSPLTLGPLIVAEQLAIPIVLLGFCTYSWPVRPGSLEQPANAHERRLAWRLRGWTRLYNEARARLGLEPVPVDARDSASLGDRFLLRSVPQFERVGKHSGGALPPKVERVGACSWQPASAQVGPTARALDAWLARAAASSQPILYVQHGRYFGLPHFWPALERAAEKRGLWLAVSTSRTDCPIEPRSDRVLARPFLPQDRVLDRAHLLVAGGNTTAVLGALVAGVPALLLPGGGEQPDVADQCARAGMAHVLTPPESVGVEQILDGIDRVLADPRYRQRAGDLARAFARRPGFAAAADALERAARGPIRPRNRPGQRAPRARRAAYLPVIRQ